MNNPAVISSNQSQTTALSTNKVVRNTYMLLSMAVKPTTSWPPSR